MNYNERNKEQELTSILDENELIKSSLLPAEESVQENFRLEINYSNQLNKLKDITGRSKSEFIRTAVILYLSRPEVQLTLSTPQSNT